MKQYRSAAASQRSLAAWLSVLLLGAACQGTGHVREVPAAFPAEDATAAPPADTQRGHRFATPPSTEQSPAGDDASDDRADTRGSDDRGAFGPNPVAPPAADAERSLGEAPASAPTTKAKPEAKPERSRGASEPRANGSALGGALDADPAWRQPLPEERPGLATHWGEDRYSPAREVEFERAAPERPLAIVELHYNDRSGARRMLPDASWGRAEKRLPSGVTVRVVDAGGRTLPALVRGGRVVAVGAPGDRYALAIENPTPRRFEVVASVDGLDVLDGEAARVDKRGYLVPAWSSLSIDGFRRSDDEVAAFRLGDVARSYAANQGQALDVGVLGFAFFDEKGPRAPRPIEPWYRPSREDTRLRQNADPFPGGYARPPVW